jgi:hypothetical protein
MKSKERAIASASSGVPLLALTRISNERDSLWHPPMQGGMIGKPCEGSGKVDRRAT